MEQMTPQLASAVHTFSQLISSTRRGARLARLLTMTELYFWGVPQDVTERAQQVVAELAANAVLHGRVPGRDFRLGLRLEAGTGVLRIEVTDARGERLPAAVPSGGGDGGRGCRWWPRSPTAGASVPPRPAARPCGRCSTPAECPRTSDADAPDVSITACQTGLTDRHGCANAGDFVVSPRKTPATRERPGA
ncbi:ATP-binding protein [Streptomyces hydrogenans]|uniref:ATP-binding protein n=1 Tax=Streptomyces hydrogenans TaxID=1873719 RepID=UPI0035DFE1E4